MPTPSAASRPLVAVLEASEPRRRSKSPPLRLRPTISRLRGPTIGRRTLQARRKPALDQLGAHRLLSILARTWPPDKPRPDASTSTDMPAIEEAPVPVSLLGPSTTGPSSARRSCEAMR